MNKELRQYLECTVCSAALSCQHSCVVKLDGENCIKELICFENAIEIICSS